MNTPAFSGTGTPTSPMPTPARSTITFPPSYWTSPRAFRTVPSAARWSSRRGLHGGHGPLEPERPLSAAVLANGAGRSIATPVSGDSSTLDPVRPRLAFVVYLKEIGPRSSPAIGRSMLRASSRLSTVPWTVAGRDRVARRDPGG